VHVVAFVPSAGPVPPPISVRDAGRERLVHDLRADEVDVPVDASGSDDASFAGDDLRRRADLQQGIHAIRDVRVARLAERDDPTVPHADVALHDAPMVEDDGVRDHEIRSTGGARRRPLLHRLP